MNSRLMNELKEGKFVFTGELEPRKITDLAEIVEEAKSLKGYVTACNVTDNPGSNACFSSLVCSYIVQRDAGVETIYQLTCRDRNRLALFSDLLGACALGIKNVLALTGDHPSLGDFPEAKPVFDLDSAQLVYMIRRMIDKGEDLKGNKIKGEVKLHVGVAVNPNADPLEPELLKFERKIKVGAEFAQTQVVFDIATIEKFFETLNSLSIPEIPILIGIFPLKSYGVAQFFDKHVPGVKVPEELMERMKKASEISDKKKRREKYDEINLEYFSELIKEIKKTKARGCHVMAVHYVSMIKALIEETRG